MERKGGREEIIGRYGVMGRKGRDHREVWGNGEEGRRS